VFEDIGIPDASTHLLKADIALKLIEVIESRGLTQVEAAKLIGSTQADIYNLNRGILKGFTPCRHSWGLSKP
jgi:predicted XRE-type DNA-binding protein